MWLLWLLWLSRNQVKILDWIPDKIQVQKSGQDTGLDISLGIRSRNQVRIPDWIQVRKSGPEMKSRN